MAMLLSRPTTGAALRSPATAARNMRVRMVVRATAEPPSNEPSTSTSEAEVFVSAPKVAPAAPAPAAVAKVPSLGEAMAFAGPGPELINGRLAMLGVLAAVGAELGTGESFFTQFASAPAIVLTTWALIAVASLVPILRGAAPDEAFGPLTPAAERINGQAAMLGVGALVLIEAIKGSALF